MCNAPLHGPNLVTSQSSKPSRSELIMDDKVKALEERTTAWRDKALEFYREFAYMVHLTNRIRLARFKDAIIARLQEGQDQLRKTESRQEKEIVAQEVQAHLAIKAYESLVRLYEILLAWERLVDTVTYAVDAFKQGLGFIERRKAYSCEKLFDQVHHFLQDHEGVGFGYDIPFPRGYEPPPKVTAVSFKVFAGN
ncbi:uncharacterized protein N0V89_011502 [Didymosphaeria variabile]|uniref:Uncharacterized protein n=1 Tax=Didymosphaeria variabile TaxID=1932322 RepID=A0A9W8XBT5_9PLEO|nr:uncharacterized protein N0V89_011502 [Didymosphaeria variabile]KAJ4345372.1 hypothetical protein N0V89_011502 [Didymosphaeria variabile]